MSPWPLKRRCELVRQHLREALRLRRRHERRLAQLALPLRRLLGEDVLLVRLAAHDLALAGALEALRGAAARFHRAHRQETPCSPVCSSAAVSAASAAASASAAFFSAFFSRSIASRLGARIIDRKRPSMRGGFSTAAI